MLELRRTSAPLEGAGRSQPDRPGISYVWLFGVCVSVRACVCAQGGCLPPLKKNKNKTGLGRDLRRRPLSPVTEGALVDESSLLRAFSRAGLSCRLRRRRRGRPQRLTVQGRGGC